MGKKDLEEEETKVSLVEAADTELEQELRKKGLEILRKVTRGIRERKKWIKARERQIAGLEALKTQLLEAYDARDDDDMHAIDKAVVKLLDMPTKNLSKEIDPFEDI